jgi:hypothetical protein
MGLTKIKFGNVPIDKHHTIFKCAVKSGVRQRLFYLPASSHKSASIGLHSRIAGHYTFRYLQPTRGRTIEQCIRGAGGSEKWLQKLGKCYQWLETQHPHYKGIYETFQKAMVDIGGAEGIIS